MEEGLPYLLPETRVRAGVLPWLVCTENKGQEGLLCLLRERFGPHCFVDEGIHLFPS